MAFEKIEMNMNDSCILVNKIWTFNCKYQKKLQHTVEDKNKFRIPFRRTAVAQLKNRENMVRRLLKTAVPFDCVTVLIFLVHRMSRSKK